MKTKRAFVKNWIEVLQNDVWMFEISLNYNNVALTKCDSLLVQQREQMISLSADDEKNAPARFKTQENINNLEKTRADLEKIINDLKIKLSITAQKLDFIIRNYGKSKL